MYNYFVNLIKNDIFYFNYLHLKCIYINTKIFIRKQGIFNVNCFVLRSNGIAYSQRNGIGYDKSILKK